MRDLRPRLKQAALGIVLAEANRVLAEGRRALADGDMDRAFVCRDEAETYGRIMEDLLLEITNAG